jgi:hypothetical protein
MRVIFPYFPTLKKVAKVATHMTLGKETDDNEGVDRAFYALEVPVSEAF